MLNIKQIISGVIALVFIIIIYSSAFIVSETDQVIITRLGKPVRKPIVNPGIHFKLPLFEETHFFDKRFLEWDGDPNQVPTRDKRYIWVDTYARWKITDPLQFFKRVRNERGAQTRLDDILDGETRNAIANHDLVEIVRSSNRTPMIDEDLGTNEQSEYADIVEGRDAITLAIIETAAPKVEELGIELLDLRFKRINYVKEVRLKIFERMITERKRIADKFRSEGQGAASEILGNKERELKNIQSKAYKTAQEIRGRADANATAIYAAAFNRNAETREFYAFIQTMETYKTTLSEKDWLILSTKGDFFKYLQKQSGR